MGFNYNFKLALFLGVSTFIDNHIHLHHRLSECHANFRCVLYWVRLIGGRSVDHDA